MRNFQFIRTRYFSRNLSISCSTQVPCCDKLKIVQNTVLKMNVFYDMLQICYSTLCFPFLVFSAASTIFKWQMKSYDSARKLQKDLSKKRNKEIAMVLCYQNCSDLLRDRIVLVIEKNFWNSRLKAENLQKFWDH